MNPLGRDRVVRGTNDDAQISKLSAVRLGYFKDQYLSYFVRTDTKRAPIINRGYYARVAALKRLIQQFLVLDDHGAGKQILSLGAGYDTAWFHLKAGGQEGLRYFEVDFPQAKAGCIKEAKREQRFSVPAKVVAKKLRVAASTPELASLLPASSEPPGSGKFVSEEYVVLPGDLRDADSICKDLQQAGFQAETPTLIIAECVLVYMSPEDSRALVSRLGVMCRSAAFIVYEQIKPYDAFGSQMMINLERRGCPLVGIHGSADLAAQMKRFTNHNWQKAWAKDMETIYYKHLDPLDRTRIERLELFDELEEWHLIQEHYCIAVGINDVSGLFGEFELPVEAMTSVLYPSKVLQEG